MGWCAWSVLVQVGEAPLLLVQVEALDAKLSQYSAAQRDELLGKKSDLEVLGMSAKDLDKFFNPPPPKAKAPAKK